MTVAIDLDITFYSLFGVVILATLISGSSFEWVVKKGLFQKYNEYHVIVAVAILTSLIQTVTCFINAIMKPNTNFGFMVYIVVNWIFMTHSSVMLVSKKLSMTYRNQEVVWKKLLLINLAMFPFSMFICVYWTVAHNYDIPVLQQAATIVEPIQIALWALIEFCLSGAFIIKMWKMHWTVVERQGIFVLVLVGICDAMSVLINLIIGDLESTCVKGFVYCLRIRLEVSVLDAMVDFVNSKKCRKSRNTKRSTYLGTNYEESYLDVPAPTVACNTQASQVSSAALIGQADATGRKNLRSNSTIADKAKVAQDLPLVEEEHDAFKDEHENLGYI